MSTKRKYLRLTFIYLLLVLGYLYLHVVDLEIILYPATEQDEVKSTVDFAYQNF